MTCTMEPTEWGWKLEENQLEPVETDLFSILFDADASRHRRISVACRVACVECVTACGLCHGIDCSNKDTEIDVASSSGQKDL